MDSQTFGDGQHDLPVSDRRTDIFGNVQQGPQGPLLVAGRASATLLNWEVWQNHASLDDCSVGK